MKHFVHTDVLLLFTAAASAQPRHQERAVLVYNTLFGGLTGGIGAVINKPRDLNWRQSFVRGAWQGSLGGLVSYCGKKTMSLVASREDIRYALPAKIIYSAGNSIIFNAARAEPFLQNWNIEYGPLRFDFSAGPQARFRARFLPGIIYSAIPASRHSVPDLEKSLWSGDLVFVTKRDLSPGGNTFVLGTSYGRSIVYSDEYRDDVVYKVIAHELVHDYQFADYQLLNAWLKPFERKVQSKTLKRIFTDYVYFDVPYFYPVYAAESRLSNAASRLNFYEFEAQRFATNRFVW